MPTLSRKITQTRLLIGLLFINEFKKSRQYSTLLQIRLSVYDFYAFLMVSHPYITGIIKSSLLVFAYFEY